MGSKSKAAATAGKSSEPSPLKEAMHQARIEAAERTSVVVDLRDAEVARLELLNEALDPLFAEIPPRSTCSIAASAAATRRGCGSTPSPMSLWGATSASIGSSTTPAIGRRVLAESHEIAGHREGGHRLRRAPAHRARAGAGRGSRIRHPHRPARGGARARRSAPRRWGTCARFCAGRDRALARELARGEPHVRSGGDVTLSRITSASGARHRGRRRRGRAARAIISQRQLLPLRRDAKQIVAGGILVAMRRRAPTPTSRRPRGSVCPGLEPEHARGNDRGRAGPVRRRARLGPGEIRPASVRRRIYRLGGLPAGDA